MQSLHELHRDHLDSALGTRFAIADRPVAVIVEVILFVEDISGELLFPTRAVVNNGLLSDEVVLACCDEAVEAFGEGFILVDVGDKEMAIF